VGFLVLAVAIAALTLGLARALGSWLPRFSAYLLGPCLFVFAVGFLLVFRNQIFESRYDVAIPGNLAPVIFGVPLGFMALVGVVLVVTGLARIQEADEAGESRRRPARDTRDVSRYQPGKSRGWLTPRKFCVLVAEAGLWLALALLAYR
jgi:hypothetical protein